MNSLGKKDIEQILEDVSIKLKLPSHALLDIWYDSVTKHFSKCGMKLKSYNGSMNEVRCQHDGCNKKVIKPCIIDDKILCSLHFKQYIKQQKRQTVTRCNHVFTSSSEAGQQCPSYTQPGTKFCKRHQKKFEL